VRHHRGVRERPHRGAPGQGGPPARFQVTSHKMELYGSASRASGRSPGETRRGPDEHEAREAPSGRGRRRARPVGRRVRRASRATHRRRWMPRRTWRSCSGCQCSGAGGSTAASCGQGGGGAVPGDLVLPLHRDRSALQQIYDQDQARGLVAIAVGMDLEGPQVLRPFADQLGLRYPVLVADDAVRSGQTAFGKVGLLPTTLIIGRDGRGGLDLRRGGGAGNAGAADRRGAEEVRSPLNAARGRFVRPRSARRAPAARGAERPYVPGGGLPWRGPIRRRRGSPTGSSAGRGSGCRPSASAGGTWRCRG
jgi:hypothetical protein